VLYVSQGIRALASRRDDLDEAPRIADRSLEALA
jgi:hypothetical protein